jgi:hypothetical protein
VVDKRKKLSFRRVRLLIVASTFREAERVWPRVHAVVSPGRSYTISASWVATTTPIGNCGHYLQANRCLRIGDAAASDSLSFPLSVIHHLPHDNLSTIANRHFHRVGDVAFFASFLMKGLGLI